MHKRRKGVPHILLSIDFFTFCGLKGAKKKHRVFALRLSYRIAQFVEHFHGRSIARKGGEGQGHEKTATRAVIRSWREGIPSEITHEGILGINPSADI